MRRFVCFVVLFFALTGASTILRAADLDEIKKSGVLTVISFPHQESEFVRTNLDLGPTPLLGPVERFVGLDVDLMAAFAAKLGVEAQIRRVSEPSYGALIPDLLAGKGDVIASSFSITAERKKKVNFSVPYLTVYEVVVTRVDSPIDSIEKIKGRRAAVVEGSSLHEALRALGVPPEDIVIVDFTVECYSAVAEGRADYTLQDSLSAKHHLPTQKSLKVSFSLPGRDDYAFAVPKESTALLAALNEFVEDERSSGRLAEVIDRHLGTLMK